jgi:hypothetical protein
LIKEKEHEGGHNLVSPQEYEGTIWYLRRSTRDHLEVEGSAQTMFKKIKKQMKKVFITQASFKESEELEIDIIQNQTVAKIQVYCTSSSTYRAQSKHAYIHTYIEQDNFYCMTQCRRHVYIRLHMCTHAQRFHHDGSSPWSLRLSGRLAGAQ